MTSLSTADLHRHVVAVPPLARSQDGRIDNAANDQIVRHLAAGGVRTLLYGGNAMFYHLTRSEYRHTLDWLDGIRQQNFLVVPSLGPSYGLAMDHADILAEHDFATAMLLPQKDIADQDGICTAVRRIVDRLGRPIVLYIKFDDYLDVAAVKKLCDDGLISWIKYAVVRDDPADDNYLRELVETVDRERVISGIGEQPAIVHMRDFGIGGYTSGCVCVAPGPSQQMLEACRAGDWQKADSLRAIFEPLEDLRNEIHPIAVLHSAVAAAGIAATGPIPPLLSLPSESDQDRIKAAAQKLVTAR